MLYKCKELEHELLTMEESCLRSIQPLHNFSALSFLLNLASLSLLVVDGHF